MSKLIKIIITIIFFFISIQLAFSLELIIPKKKPNIFSIFIIPQKKPAEGQNQPKENIKDQSKVNIKNKIEQNINNKIDGILIPKKKPIIVKKQRLKLVKKTRYYNIGT